SMVWVWGAVAILLAVLHAESATTKMALASRRAIDARLARGRAGSKPRIINRNSGGEIGSPPLRHRKRLSKWCFGPPLVAGSAAPPPGEDKAGFTLTCCAGAATKTAELCRSRKPCLTLMENAGSIAKSHGRGMAGRRVTKSAWP